MKKTIGVFLLVCLIFLGIGITNAAEAASKVRGYTKRSTGTYVAPHYRSTRDSSKMNNWSTKGNYNPYTGKKGYISPWR